MKIKELIFDENDPMCGIQAMSFVTYPAIEKDFHYFNKEDFLVRKRGGVVVEQPKKDPLLNDDNTWKYWKMATRNNQTPVIDTSHEFCRHHALGSPDLSKDNPGIYTIPEINGWHLDPDAQYGEGWIKESRFTQDFNGVPMNYNLDQQLYNCRHFLTPVRDINEVKKAGIRMNSHKEHFTMDFKVSDGEQRIVKGVAMIPNVLIYRRDHQTDEEYYVYFTEATIRKLKERYGFNREITIQHEENITGNAILLNSWIFDGTNDDCGYTDLKIGSWCLSYKILNERLWQMIKERGIRGFSVEALMPVDDVNPLKSK